MSRFRQVRVNLKPVLRFCVSLALSFALGILSLPFNSSNCCCAQGNCCSSIGGTEAGSYCGSSECCGTCDQSSFTSTARCCSGTPTGDLGDTGCCDDCECDCDCNVEIWLPAKAAEAVHELDGSSQVAPLARLAPIYDLKPETLPVATVDIASQISNLRIHALCSVWLN